MVQCVCVCLCESVPELIEDGMKLMLIWSNNIDYYLFILFLWLCFLLHINVQAENTHRHFFDSTTQGDIKQTHITNIYV